ncbi:TetR family transcriptional regulator [Paenibacillus sp. J2TS4]|uniref:acyl-CoA-like ligand-binding transcription factor n=1 Tax=Paenibacillus sp. J2TS4 TaxID=2807194 RepID=UPI001B106B4E|nr:TetR family transcriptional regulator [Paenibacillus sp. J2TS4]GIP36175.1 TetR family transcriptional regulator [Paenibacillus sp. J2TS4]
MSSDKPLKLGLRERKKIKTRAAIQHHALRLFREQGYNETTVEQISEASEISPSTFFRYFPTKEAVVLEDDHDDILIRAFRNQPAELSPIQALRQAVKTGFSEIPDDEYKAMRQRLELVMSVPELRAATFHHLLETLKGVAELIAERVGRPKDDFYIFNLAGAFVGIIMSALSYCMVNPEVDNIQAIDDALAHLEAGLPI